MPVSPSNRRIFERARRDMRAATSRIDSKLASSSMSIASTSSVSQSRITRSQRSGSWKMQLGVRSVRTLACISLQIESRLRRSRANALDVAPAPAVRTTSPTPSGSGSLSRMRFRRLRSVASPIFFDTPRSVAPCESLAPGIITRYRPGMDRLAVTLGPLVDIGPLVTWTIISEPGGKRLAISSLESLVGLRPPFCRPRRSASPPSSSSSSRRVSASGVMSQ